MPCNIGVYLYKYRRVASYRVRTLLECTKSIALPAYPVTISYLYLQRGQPYTAAPDLLKHRALPSVNTEGSPDTGYAASGAGYAPL
jgi:hypothetical protein